MATASNPSNDSVELKFKLPPGITSATDLQIVLTNSLGEVINDAEPAISIEGSNYATLSSNMRFTVAQGKRRVNLRLRFKRIIEDNSNVVVSVVPITNKAWFLETAFRTNLIFRDSFIVNTFTKPTTLIIAEKDVGEVDCNFSYPLQHDLNLQIRIAHITTNSASVNNLQLSVDGGVGWIDLGSNKTIMIPKGISTFKLKIPTLDDKIVTTADKRFEIIFAEQTAPETTNINTNNKITVSIRDTSDIPYGTLIRNYCIGLDLWGLYANGAGGTYTELIKIDSFDCGFTYPPAGTALVSFCAGTTRVSHIADGNGNYTKRIDGYDSSLCADSYGTRPITTTVTPTKLTGTGKDGTVKLNVTGNVFTGLNRDQASTSFRTMYGKWYFEVELYLPQRVHKAISLGFATELANLNNIVGTDKEGWSYQTVEERKFTNNVKNTYVGRLEVKDKDVISVLLDNESTTFSLWLNGRDLGPVFNNLSKERLMFVIGARDDSWAYVNFGHRGFKYTPPVDYYHGFGEIPNPPLEKDTLIRTYCEGKTLVSVFADGRGSTYTTRKDNSVDCGWIDPKPPKGTILSYFCKGLHRWKMVADGNSGSYEQFHEYNSPDCGYVKPVIVGNFTPTIWDRTKAHSYSTFDVSMTQADFKGKVYTEHNVDHGIWYVEFTKWDAKSYIGIYNDNNFFNSPLLTGFFGFDPSTGTVIREDGSTTKISDPIPANKIIGISLDFKKQESCIYIDGVKIGTIKTGLNYPADVSKKYGFAACTKDNTISSIVKANFGQLIFSNSVLDHVPGFGPSTAVHPKRGTPLHEFCKDWELWSIYADGNGGTYSVLKKVDSTECGWYPDPPIDTILDEYCINYDRVQKVATGNYQYKIVIIQANSRQCGYVPYGELLEWYCQGYTKLGKYSNGAGGFYIAIVEYDSVDCGSPIIPAGTVLREFCAGYTKVQHKADGKGGYYRFVLEENSTSCGYVPPTANGQDILTPTIWKIPSGSSTVILSNGRRDASALKRDGVQTEYSTIFGKWYFEITVFIPAEVQKAPALGVSTINYNPVNWLGSDRYSWAWWTHEGTKYTNDSQGFYNQGLKLKDKDVVSVLIDLQDNSKIEFWVNGVPIGVLYDNLPQLTPLFFTFNAVNDSYLSANFGQNAFKYPVPTDHYPGFGVLKNPPPARGTLLTTYCKEFEQWGEYADGRFGTYDAKIKDNARECGWTDPTPPTGTILGYTCVGYDRYATVADGAGGSTSQLIGINHKDCGYVPPPPPEMTTAFFDKAFAGPDTWVEEDEVTATIQGVITSADNNYSGLWYYEVEIKDLNTIIGVTESKTNYSQAPGRLATSFGWAIGHNVFIKNGVETPMTKEVSVKVGDVVGVYLDYVNEKMNVTVNGNVIAYTFPFPTPSNTYYLAFGNYVPTISTTVKVRFTPESISTVISNDYQKGWGTPRTRRTKKYTFNTYYCTGTTRYKRLHDGNGGYFGEIFEVNSTACGYVPPPAAGTILGYFCVGVERWKRVADGVGGSTNELVETRSTICGYKPFGTLLSIYCDGFDKYGVYSDGEFGSYNELIQSNSRECGYDDGSGGTTEPGSGPELDPNLPPNDIDGLIYNRALVGHDGSLVYKDPIKQPKSFEKHGLIRPIQVSYDDY